jgi:FkbM family methyltransferase
MKSLVQIGANSGKDHVFDFIKQNNFDKIVLVEPIPFIIDSLRSTYDGIANVFIENLAVVPDDCKEVVIYYDGSPNANYEVSTVFRDHLVGHGCGLHALKSMNVPALNINDLFAKYNLTHIDYLFIDVEGLDCDLVCAINYDIYGFDCIQFESRHTDGAFKRGAKLEHTIKNLELRGFDILDNGIDLKARRIK